MKKIIVCCDGTWNKPGNLDRGVEVKTNVQKIYLAISQESDQNKQVKYYGQGVGTGFTVNNHLFGGSFGVDIDSHIQDAYKFIMWNYEPGDKIFLFGFSRGAYTVRSLSGLIRNCGVIKPEFLSLVNEAYHLYRDRSTLTSPESDLIKAFKKSYSTEAETRIRFIGVWDTVGALGIPNSLFNWYNKRYNFHDVKLGSHIDFAYHALAIDEKRKIFEPSLWEVKQTTAAYENPASGQQVCQQTWFPGVHSNIGGGYADSGLSDIALEWMVEKANKVGLEFYGDHIKNIKADSAAESRNSATGIFALTKKRLRDINKGIVKRKDPVSKKMVDVVSITNESVHYSCFERSAKMEKYLPLNVKHVFHKTPFDPTKDLWKSPWMEYLKKYQ